MKYTNYSELSENETHAFRAQVWSRLPVATAEDVKFGRQELLHTVAPIIDQLPSAKRHEQDTTNTAGWRGGNTISVVVLSAEDQARVAGLLRAWQRGV